MQQGLRTWRQVTIIQTLAAECGDSAAQLNRYETIIFHVTLEQAEDGWFVVECPALPGCVSQGLDEKEALENIKEAITAWLWAEDQKFV